MGGQERCCKGGGVPGTAREVVQWVGRNQGCNGRHGDGVDDGGRRQTEKRQGCREAKENTTCRAARGCKTEEGIGAGGEGEGPVVKRVLSVVAIPFGAIDSVDWRSR
eukprot:scaffold16620_cov279-Amphora_coffeaeformis.AAC.1